MVGLQKTGFDYVIVGAGTAGCTLAGRLTENSNATVCLLEAGPSDGSLTLRIPALGFLSNRGDTYLTRDASEPDPGLNNRSVPWVHGRVLGGGSSVNGMIYMRGHSSEYDAWNCEGWRFKDVLPMFLKAECSDRAPSPWHGTSGPVSVTKGSSALPICDAFLAALSAAGYPILDDLNADAPAGFGHYDHAIGSGKRSSMANAYLRPATKHPCLTVLTGATALCVRFSGNHRASSVDVLHDGRTVSIEADQEVILCGGAINTPHLLMLSGVGPAEQLRENGVAVVASAPQVGRNLQNHVRYAMQFTCEAPITAYQWRRPYNAVKGVAQYAFSRRGFLGRTILSTGGGFSTDAAKPIADVKVSLFNALMETGSGRFGTLPRRDGFSVVVHQGSPRSRGEIRLRSGNPLDRPLIRPGIFSEPEDLAVLQRGVSQMRAAMARKEMTRYGVREILPRSEIQTDAALTADIRDKAANIFHDAGSCRMGSDDASVVDETLRVRGVSGLRVADASVIPTLMNANTNAPVNMIAEKAANLIRSEAGF